METALKISTKYFNNYLNTLNKDILPALKYFEERTDCHFRGTIVKAINCVFNDHKNYLDLMFNNYKVKKILQLGDMHRRGQCTLLVETNNDTFICKPVDTALIAVKNKILNLLNISGGFNFICLNIRSNHVGYTKIEYIENTQCVDAQKFAHHYGALIFIFVLLRGVDFHFENIFCVSSVPVVVDCESLFYPTISDSKPYDVTATSLVPTKYNSKSLMQKMDLSNQHVKQGIISAYNVFKKDKSTLINIVMDNCDKKVRMIFKPTQFYYALLKNSTHPRFLINREKQINYLHDSLLGDHKISKAIISSEINDLSNLDIPYFYFQNNKLFNSENMEIEQNFLQSSSNEIVHDVINLKRFKDKLIKTMGI